MTPFSTKKRRARALLAAVALVIAVPASTVGAQAHPNPATAFATLAADAPAGSRIVPLINSGDRFNGTTFQGIPDGLGIVPVGDGSKYIDIFVAFEQSHVPFSGFADFEDSSVQRARLDVNTLQITKLKEMLPAKAGYIRFCSATMVGPAEGFDSYTFLLNEESNDVLPLNPSQPYGADAEIAPYRQAGYSVWLDTKTGKYGTIAGAGRLNHENTVVVPGGWGGVVALTGDDTFSAPSSQLYMYWAADSAAFKQGAGSLLAFRVTSKNDIGVDAGDPFNHANDYLDISAGDTLDGTFIEVPVGIATGTQDYPEGSGNGPQTSLEVWSNDNNVFQFVRVEDISYDPDSPRTIYFTDTGTSRLAESTTTGRLIRLGSGGTTSNGRVFKMDFDASDPTVAELSILADSASATSAFVNPDNIAVGHDGIMVQEDASSTNDIWYYSFGSGSWARVATVTQAAAETSGIVDASEWLGAGWWIFDVQSHENRVTGLTDLTYQPLPSGTPLTYRERLEWGQLDLLYIPGS